MANDPNDMAPDDPRRKENRPRADIIVAHATAARDQGGKPNRFRELRLGRKKAADPRDRTYLAVRAVPNIRAPGVTLGGEPVNVTIGTDVPSWASDLPRQYRHHKRAREFPLDQDGWSACVGYAFTELVMEGPIMQHLDRLMREGGYTSLDDFIRRGWYLKAQQVDEWTGQEPDYYGTSMRAGAKVGQDYGFWPNYWWLTSVEEVVRYLILHGPVVLGVDWFSGMFDVDAKGFLPVTGSWEGGHALCADETNVKDAYIGGPQSWGSGSYVRWKLHFDDLEYLLSLGGDALAIPEIRVPK